MNNIITWVLGISAIIVFILLLALSPFTIIGAGQRGVVVRFGHVSDKVLSEGFHIIHPLDNVQEFSVQTIKYETTAGAASKDLQSVTATIAVNYNLLSDSVDDLYKNVKGDYEANILSPAILDSVKAVTAQYTAEELITKRAEVSENMETLLRERTGQYATISTISIVNFEFSRSFNEAIEAKVTAEQEALAAKNKLEQTKYEAEQSIVKAQAEAESIRIQAQALAGNTDLVELEAVRRWNGVLPSYVLGDAVPFINL